MDSENVENTFTCGICLETFDEGEAKCPRMLSCGHSFCHSCLEKLLEEQSQSCPTCKTGIQFATAESIPINYSLKSLINVRSQISTPRICSGKYLSEGYCTEHDTYKGMRCMNCEVWICGLCSTLQHKRCRTILVAEAYKELKKPLSQKAKKEMRKREDIKLKLAASLMSLNEDKKSLIEEIKIKEQELKDRETRIGKLEDLQSQEKEFSDRLEQLQKIVDSSTDDIKLPRAMNELEKLLEKGKEQIPDCLTYINLPQSREALNTLIQNGPIYVVEDGYDGTRYGKIEMVLEKIYVHSFIKEKPQATIFNFQAFLSHFKGSSDLPKKCFLMLNPKNSVGNLKNVFHVIIETDSLSPRAKNFTILCAALKGKSFKGMTLLGFSFCYKISPGPLPVVEGIRNNYCGIKRKKGGVYGMSKKDSWFGIQLKDSASYSSSPKFGDVVFGLECFKDIEGHCLVLQTGLVIEKQRERKS